MARDGDYSPVPLGNGVRRVTPFFFPGRSESLSTESKHPVSSFSAVDNHKLHADSTSDSPLYLLSSINAGGRRLPIYSMLITNHWLIVAHIGCVAGNSSAASDLKKEISRLATPEPNCCRQLSHISYSTPSRPVYLIQTAPTL
jgi:hypothetical protein